MPDWLTEKLKNEIRDYFEPKYKRRLTDGEVVEIAENLTGYFETLLKFRWRQAHEKKIQEKT